MRFGETPARGAAPGVGAEFEAVGVAVGAHPIIEHNPTPAIDVEKNCRNDRRDSCRFITFPLPWDARSGKTSLVFWGRRNPTRLCEEASGVMLGEEREWECVEVVNQTPTLHGPTRTNTDPLRSQGHHQRILLQASAENVRLSAVGVRARVVIRLGCGCRGRCLVVRVSAGRRQRRRSCGRSFLESGRARGRRSGIRGRA